MFAGQELGQVDLRLVKGLTSRAGEAWDGEQRTEEAGDEEEDGGMETGRGQKTEDRR